jgi:AmiR/NasT family two-component response regulator
MADGGRSELRRLRVLVANERQDRLSVVAAVVAGLGHEVLAPQIEVSEIGAVAARERPDVAIVGLGESSQHALEMIEQVVHEAVCPVVALLHQPDPTFVVEAAKRGVFAYLTNGDPADWQNAIEIVLRRFAQIQELELAFTRRLTSERAKGILIEREGVDELEAVRLLRERARVANSTLSEAAQSLIDETAAAPRRHRLASDG